MGYSRSEWEMPTKDSVPTTSAEVDIPTEGLVDTTPSGFDANNFGFANVFCGIFYSI